MSAEWYEIQPEDVGRRYLRVFGRRWDLADVMGPVQHGDVYKRLYRIGDILQVESNDQRNDRLAADGRWDRRQAYRRQTVRRVSGERRK